MIPLLILGKRATGKSTALAKFALDGYYPIITVTEERARYLRKRFHVQAYSFKNIPSVFSKEFCVDEFSHCSVLPEGEIMALTDDPDNMQIILKYLADNEAIDRQALERKLIGTTDAKVWAEEFVKLVKRKPEIATDEDTMLGWFANAIMAGVDSK